jgi:hypothetical protein
MAERRISYAVDAETGESHHEAGEEHKLDEYFALTSYISTGHYVQFAAFTYLTTTMIASNKASKRGKS